VSCPSRLSAPRPPLRNSIPDCGAGRTEQHWCPIKHARRVQHPHDRYSHFLPYGDAHAYRERIDEVRDDFKDLKARK